MAERNSRFIALTSKLLKRIFLISMASCTGVLPSRKRLTKHKNLSSRRLDMGIKQVVFTEVHFGKNFTKSFTMNVFVFSNRVNEGFIEYISKWGQCQELVKFVDGQWRCYRG
jgi:hypothetical protein